MRLALVICAVLLLGIAPSVVSTGTPGTVGAVAPVASHGSVSPQQVNLGIPSHIFRTGTPGACTRSGSTSINPAISPIDLPAAGTGASATAALESIQNNTAVNTTLVVPTGSLTGSSNSAQYEIMGIADPWNATTFMAAGMAKAYVSEVSTTYTLPVAYLPNGTAIVDEDILDLTTLNEGGTYYFNITHVHGDWWSFTENGNLIQGAPAGISNAPPSPAWENGTFNLGAPVASGTLCEEGGTVGPSFIAATYATNTTLPQLPKTYVPWAVGVEPKGQSSTNYVPTAANAMPQFNATLGVVGLEGHIQSSSIRTDALYVGSVPSSAVTYPGEFASIWGNYKVQILNQSSVSPQSASLAYTGTQVFSATALNQTGVTIPGAKYSWAVSPASLGTLVVSGASATLTAGSTTVAGKVWANVSYNCSHLVDVASVTVTPTGGPSISSFTATNTTLVVGGAVSSTTLKVVNASWPRWVGYQYSGLPAGCASSNHSTIVCTPSAPGDFNVTVYVNDSTHHSSNATLSLAVYPDIAISTFTVAPNPVSYNTSTRFVVSATGGIPSLIYTYAGLPRGCTNGTGSAILGCTPTQVGAFTVWVWVNDSHGDSKSMSTTLTVNQPVAITAFTASPSSIEVGQTTFLNVTITGGTKPYTIMYSGLPTGCTSENVTSLTCVPGINNTFFIQVNVTDHTGSNDSATTLLSVTAPPLPVITAFTASVNPVNVSKTTFLNVTAAGGTGVLSYAYTGLPGGCTTSNTSSLACTPTSAGTTTVTVTVTDSAHHTASKTLSLTVTALPGKPPVITSFVVSPDPIKVNGTATFEVVASSPSDLTLTYSYTGLPTGCTSSNTADLACTPTAKGNYTVTVFVNDTAGHAATPQTTSLEVLPSQGSNTCTSNCGGGSGSASGISSTDYVIIGVVIAAAVVGVVLLLMRKKKTPPAPLGAYNSPPPSQPGMASSPPPARAPPPQGQGPAWPPRQ